MNKRFYELDSLRGLAALTVVFHHYLLIFPFSEAGGNDIFDILKYSPLHIFWSGHAAVVLFFLLSGFVLSLPYINHKNAPYSSYLIKRITRIYFPYFVSLIIAVSAAFLFANGGIKGLSEWFNSVWNTPFDFSLILQHLMMLGNYNNGEFNPVYWSLVYEMRISIIFPLIMIFLMKYKWKYSLGGSFIVAFGAYVTSRILFKIGIVEDYSQTLFYMFMFMVGAILAKHRNYLIGWYQKQSKLIKISLVALAVLCYTFEWWGNHFTPFSSNVFLNDISITLGSSIFIIVSLSSIKVKNILLKKPLVFLGNISYSLYLYHVIPLLIFLHQFYGDIPTFLILAMSFISALVLATLSYYFVEKPSKTLGGRISNNLTKSKNKVA